MRSVYFLLGGALLLAMSHGAIRLITSNAPDSARLACVLFLMLWFVVCAFNLWLGVARAGYPLTVEIPVFLLQFLVPAALTVLVQWRWVR
ncbi:MAG: hypothetical protein H7293_04610 [Candidatus Saccharibacteria bacterium]|nr:hypothetical protein [Rhodoferax sp.]